MSPARLSRFRCRERSVVTPRSFPPQVLICLSRPSRELDLDRWCCDGPLVSAPRQRGFGTIVMEAMTERSTDGAVQRDYAPSGLIWRLTCPAASALEPMRM
jgi:hypothetical protein